MRNLGSICPALLVAALMLAVGQDVRADPPMLNNVNFGDFMVMRVCVDSGDKIVPGLAPTDAGCDRDRPIHVGEVPPYWLHDFPSGHAECDGGIAKVNIPIEQHGTTRVASLYASTGGDACNPNSPSLTVKGISVQWRDDAYFFIMGSWSPVDLSSFDTPTCNANPSSSLRFFRGWVIAPLSMPDFVSSGWGAFPSRLARGPASKLLGACATQYNRALTTWAVLPVTFTGGLVLQTIVSNHFSRGNEAGDEPGDAMQVERTYWTAEFGLSRWEKWAREDWVNPRSSETASVTSQRLASHNACGAPAPFPTRITSVLEGGAISRLGGWNQILSNSRTDTSYDWFMTLCHDYTNLDRGDRGLPDVTAALDDAYWQE